MCSFWAIKKTLIIINEKLSFKKFSPYKQLKSMDNGWFNSRIDSD